MLPLEETDDRDGFKMFCKLNDPAMEKSQDGIIAVYFLRDNQKFHDANYKYNANLQIANRVYGSVQI